MGRVFRIMVLGFLAVAMADAAAQPAQSPVESVTVTGQALLDNPDGKGDPDAISCRKPQQMPGSRLMAPPVCKHNGEWAQIRKNGNDVSPDGTQIVDSEKARTLRLQICLPPAPLSINHVFDQNFGARCY